MPGVKRKSHFIEDLDKFGKELKSFGSGVERDIKHDASWIYKQAKTGVQEAEHFVAPIANSARNLVTNELDAGSSAFKGFGELAESPKFLIGAAIVVVGIIVFNAEGIGKGAQGIGQGISYARPSLM
jgi:hypothetical protein